MRFGIAPYGGRAIFVGEGRPKDSGKLFWRKGPLNVEAAGKVKVFWFFASEKNFLLILWSYSG